MENLEISFDDFKKLYKIIKQIGKGSYGVVYEVLNIKSN